MWTEQAISSCLNGTFTRVTYGGRVETRSVPWDFIPAYGAPQEPKRVATRNTPRRAWSDDDVRRLVSLRAEGMSIADAARSMGRCPKHARHVLRNAIVGAA